MPLFSRSWLVRYLSTSRKRKSIQRRKVDRVRRLMMERLDPRLAMAGDTVTIFAAGSTNQETMQLLIDGNVVQTWNNVGGNVSTPSYVAYSYVSNTTLSPDRIRVAFTNDLYNPPTIDRNLRIDRIQINSTTYQTEAPTVYSTGTWAAADGVQPGFRQSEFLHTNGYLQYSVNNGSTIQVLAAGWTGNENMELQIDGRTVFGWNAVSGNPFNRQFNEYTYRAAGTVTADRVRVAFTNDFYQPPSIDYNITIDKLIVDGVEFESESPTTYSTALTFRRKEPWCGAIGNRRYFTRTVTCNISHAPQNPVISDSRRVYMAFKRMPEVSLLRSYEPVVATVPLESLIEPTMVRLSTPATTPLVPEH